MTEEENAQKFKALLATCKKIYDDIHGIVHLSKLEVNLIDSPYFQRLRHIKQLGLSELIFPATTHSRFSHSIGVLAIAQRVSKHLNLSAEDQCYLRLAALLHDIGHFPLSHTIEKVYENIEKETKDQDLQKYVKPGKSIKKEEGYIEPNKTNPRDLAYHELCGKRIIEESNIADLLKSAGIVPNKVAAIICGNYSNQLISQLVHSDMDIDRMDYLLRDSKNAGIAYGQFDLDYLIESLEKYVYKGNEILCVNQKGLHTVEHFLLARYFWYLQIIYHKAVAFLDSIAQKIYKDLINLKIAYSLQEVQAIMLDEKRIFQFNDNYFHCLLEDALSNGKIDSDTHELIKMIKERKISGQFNKKAWKEEYIEKKETNKETSKYIESLKRSFIGKAAKKDSLLSRKGLDCILKKASFCENEKEMIDNVDDDQMPIEVSDRQNIRIILNKEYKYDCSKGEIFIDSDIPDSPRIVLLNKFHDSFIETLKNRICILYQCR